MTSDSPGSGTTAGPGNDEDKRAELERLRAEVSYLRAQQADRNGTPPEAAAAPGARHGRWRAPVAVLAIFLGCVLALVSVLGVWAANQVSNTDRYVANVTPLIGDPAIQGALSTKITAAITRLTSPGTQARQGRERHALSGLVIDRLPQARYRLNSVNNFAE